jgi:hypothetical protein
MRSSAHGTDTTLLRRRLGEVLRGERPCHRRRQEDGGKVEQNIKSGIFQNACPIRMSYVLNCTGVPVPRTGYAIVSGADSKWYMYRVNDMMSFLETAFGAADKTAKGPKTTDFAGLKGLIVVKGSGWSNARGHVTLWNGTTCSDTCHLLADPDNGSFTPEVAALWSLH